MNRPSPESRGSDYFSRAAHQLDAAAERKDPEKPRAVTRFSMVLEGAAAVTAGISASVQEVSRCLEPVAKWTRSAEGAAALRLVVAFVEDIRRRGGGEEAATRALVKVAARATSPTRC